MDIAVLGPVTFELYGVSRPFASHAETPDASRERPAATGDDA